MNKKRSKSRRSKVNLSHTEHSKENVNSDLNIVNKEKVERKPATKHCIEVCRFKKSGNHTSIDALIKKSIRKVKEKQQMENVSRMEKMMKQKLLKESQGQRNKAIRELNAKHLSLTQVARHSALNKYTQLEPKKSQRKENGPGQAHVPVSYTHLTLPTICSV
eukprot:TRINITY_DN3123_c0_g1_i1.p1 TRINITY_DN3123_c0_g1~~TRINITY_DN3123_c0_g1_i1.p1  ORF type:complete len:162 (+),score=41.01 TRINITY_DN3123_c0_g1_i1:660-1145(+)